MQLKKQMIHDYVTSNDNQALADSVCASNGYYFGLYWDGENLSHNVGSDVGCEIAENERPIAMVKCTDINDQDMSWWRAGWDCAHLTDAEVVAECCRDGEVITQVDELVGKLWNSCSE